MKKRSISKMSLGIVSLVLFFTATACTSLEVIGYDKEKNTVSVKTAELDSKYAATKEAREYCASKVTLLNPDEKPDDHGITIYKFTCDR